MELAVVILLGIAVAGWVVFLVSQLNLKGAWDIDATMWFGVRDKVLKDRYAGCTYFFGSSFSNIIIHHRKPLTLEDRKRLHRLFPKWIRLEFQEVAYEGEVVNFLVPECTVFSAALDKGHMSNVVLGKYYQGKAKIPGEDISKMDGRAETMAANKLKGESPKET